ncbi:MAG: Uma2 family endonuclease [Microscillaceae bacterium]|jgi:Uma2 family endonuclease|nr:Uma2 family endonuclease [Microscillaceae bacterium]
MLTLTKTEVSMDEYLALEFPAKTKSEYIAGEIIPMPYTSENHGKIATNLAVNLGICLKKLPFQMFIADRMLLVEATGNIFYPDLMIVAEPPASKQVSANMTATLNPVVLIEILSESNSENDLLTKLWDYKKIPTLQQYLIFWQTRPQVDTYTRLGTSDDWLNSVFTPQNPDFKILNCPISLNDIYEKVNLKT